MRIEDIELADIYEFIETGNPDNAPEAISDYLVLLDKTYKLTLRIDKFGSRDAVLAHLMKAEKLSRYMAAKIYNDSLEYFYNDQELSKKAWRNFYATIMDKAIRFAQMTMKDPNDAKRVVEMADKALAARGGYDPEPEEIDEALLRAPFIVYSCDADFLGIPKVDRVRLNQQIDAYPQLSEKEREQIKREAMILPLKILPHEQDDARKA